MIQPGLIEDLIDLDRIAKKEGQKFPLKRYLFPHLTYLLTRTRQMTSISGLRETGKTILTQPGAAKGIPLILFGFLW